MSATTLNPTPAPLLTRFERLRLGARLTLAMAAAGLLALATVWRVAFPADPDVANLVAGTAAAIVALPVLTAAWGSLRHPSLHGVTDRLIALALVGCWAAGDLFTAALLPIVMIAGHVLEERSLLGSRDAIRALSRLAEQSARRLTAAGTETVPTGALRAGDRIELRPGDRAPADGTIAEGQASLDTASLTGESVPLEVGPGDRIMAGTINTNGRLVVRVERTGSETTLGRIVALMREAEAAKPPVTRLLEAYAGQYMVLVLMVAGGTWLAGAGTAATLAVLVAACPCALVLAAPAAAIAGIAVAGRHGILIKGTAFLEHLAEVTAVVFDKTGTLTTGNLQLADTIPEQSTTPEHLLALAASLGAASTHPVSRAAAAASPARLALEGVREEGGFGLTATCGGVPVAFGRPELLERHGITVSPPPAHEGPIAAVAEAGTFRGWLLFADRPRPEAPAALADLAGLGLRRQILLTGDRRAVAHHVAATLGIEDIESEALPDAKMRRVLAEIRAGWRPLVVGDGINDSLALKAGAVGVAMGAHGTDVTLASADLVLMGNDLRRLATSIRLSRACRRTIGQNVALGLAWTAALTALAATGQLGAEGALVAALLHNVSTFLGVANAGRLLRFDETTTA